MVEVLSRTDLGDPSRLHQEALAARAIVEEARSRIAAALGARPREVVFTSGAAESIAAASWGASRSRGAHTVLSAVEHSAVREWASRGPATVVGVDAVGRVDPVEIATAVGDQTGLVHCQLGNHEVGTLQPVAEVVAAVDGRALVHCDATQAIGRVPFDFGRSGLDLVSIDGHLVGGPAGIGILLVRRGVRVEPLVVGGDQERARRAGIEPVAAAAGFAAALEEATAALPAEADRQRGLTADVVAWAGRADGIAVLGDPVERLPHLVCLGLDGVEPQPVLLGLDAAGVAVHSGSSCSSEALEPSPVLEAMGAEAHRSLRVSVGWDTTPEDVRRFCSETERIVAQLRALARG